MRLDGLGTLLVVQWRTGWKAASAWVAGAVVLMLVTAWGVADLYPDAASRAGYAATQANPTSYMLNGRIAGLDTLGGIMANEFSFLGALLFPLLGVALVNRATRRDEESGRLELLRTGPIGRQAPLVAALMMTGAVALVCGAVCTLLMTAYGVELMPSIAFGLSWTALSVVFAGVTAVAAQVVERSRVVWMVGAGVLVVAYLLRGIGAVNDNWVLWASPLGWVETVRPFGDLRWWPIALALGVAALLSGAALWTNRHRDLGDALIRGRAGEPNASRWLLHDLGRAVLLRRGVTIGWFVVTVILMSVYGLLTEQVISAIEDNPQVGDFVGAGLGADLLDRVFELFLMVLAFIVAGFLVQGVVALHGEEERGQVEYELAGARSRAAWLAGRLVALLAAGVLVAAGGAVAVAVTAAQSTGDAGNARALLVGSLWFVPAVLVFVALPVALFGVAPGVSAGAWAVFAAAVLLAYMGLGFGWPDRIVALSPFRTIGEQPLAHGSVSGVSVLLAVSAGLLALGFLGFRRRDVPGG